MMFTYGASGFVPAQQLPVVRSGRACSQVAMLSPAQEKKAEQLEQIKDLMSDKALAFAVRSESIPVNALNDLRQKIPEGVHMQCIKNTLMRRAVGSEGLERFNAIAGGEGRKDFDVTRKSNYWFLVPEDKMRESVDLWNDWAKENKKARCLTCACAAAPSRPLLLPRQPSSSGPLPRSRARTPSSRAASAQHATKRAASGHAYRCKPQPPVSPPLPPPTSRDAPR